MSYSVGQKVCLWQIQYEKQFDSIFLNSVKLHVLKEVIVTISEIKTGVFGEFSNKSVSAQSLRGVGEDGNFYEKHWESWPESQLQDFIDSWSIRDDGNGDSRFWIPKEAVYVYNSVSRQNGPNALTLVGDSGITIEPKGDVVYCEKHDRYSHRDNKCFFCRVPKQEA
ncbi:hypothetical protein A2662_03365 [Candidatus Giovannonibacteria bacterium RIFCSPHIGHO2_01_FULL_45_33]|uniref:Uncharacterized protein n=1 Tax=Candidatus Giovannonibacteria bacterium RIFCSPLOWO2_01_FULL_45_34 TaxID=1798351 RepID=A0A1F5X0B1_9BACT|nr:MAG: hypothetical protein A2662_03365 [Candidatus Giovannonibacteria bacterium RIFCSPHIGHO2_01_FULL_45_33]OGF70271.1 MAG: hypothetical protein A3C73_01250 [Candidatus Giovannonibacteria bacterium RIFCSPHIGHO2_02_FULL_44_11]OGF81319.1 MAG: hypothetical protein A2930_03595 [Candidatus Giovannonibacteria bacterium RIFCSPLOWO2_01_FULL_45_34]